MMRVPVLALLLALAPFAWAEETFDEWDEKSEMETTDVLAGDSKITSVDESTTTPVAEDPASDSDTTIAAVATDPASASAPVVGSESAPAVSESADALFHRVVKGDTLWDLAGSYMNNPFLWPKIFEANSAKIKNPDLIYPDQEFLIPSVLAADKMDRTSVSPVVPEEPTYIEEVVPEEVVAVSEPEAVDPVVSEEGTPSEMDLAQDVEENLEGEEGAFAQDEREAIKKRSKAVPGAGFMGGIADTFLADENWEYDGYVLRDRDQRMMISQGDVVYLNIGAAAGVKEKMMANVYRVGKKVKDPYLKKKTVRMVKRVGTVMVTGQINAEGCTAVVTNSLEAIRIGDIVKFVAR
jgi:LysM repeat protein